MRAPPAQSSWMTEFEAFSTFHLVAVVACLGLAAAACALGLWLRGTAGERRLRVGWAWFTLLFQGVNLVWWLLPGNWDVDRSVPLQLCRIMAVLAPVAILTEARLPRALLYFWGLGLCSQGFITPVFKEGLASEAFWFFWVGHLQIVGSALYDVVVRGYRPNTREFVWASLLGIAYVVAVVPVNLAFGFNFGNLGRTDYGVGTLGNLAPWPWRPLAIYAMAQFALLVLWLVLRERGRGAGSEPALTASEARPPSTPLPSTAPLR
ncbi:MAG: TIGR02206 family membrane protein [Phycisphaerales bacterium]